MKRTPEQISKNMRMIRNKDTHIELTLSKSLWRKGYRFRKNSKSIFGCPDISIKKFKIAIFCDSEFWHGLNWVNDKDKIKTNREFWVKKIEKNIERDLEVTEHLLNQGWIVLRFSEKQILKNTDECIRKIEEVINERKK
jgi:DNA mismatch endonuclease, patch repair protein